MPPLLQLEDEGKVWVHLDHAHMGVGGDNSWSPTVLEPYLVKPGYFSFGFTITPVRGAE